MLVDYSVLRPSMSTLKAAGVTAVGRYIGWDGEPGFSSTGKNLTKTEAHELLAAGVGIWLVFEYDPQAALKGAAQGAKDAHLAARQLADLGAPKGVTVYFALDFDIRDYAPASSDPRAELGPAAGYFEAVTAAASGFRVGVYGGYWAVSRVLDAHLAAMGWQTIAWSGGQWDKRAVLRQMATQVFGGADVNIHEATSPDWGQWPRPAAPPPGQQPFPSGRHTADGTGTLAALAKRQGCDVRDIWWETTRVMVTTGSTGFGHLQGDYLDAGKWDAKMPKGLVLWLP